MYQVDRLDRKKAERARIARNEEETVMELEALTIECKTH